MAATTVTFKPNTASRARQPTCEPWSIERLRQMRAMALGQSLSMSSKLVYLSALNSYLNFCHIHNFPVDPTEDTISFYIVYMCYHINPRSVTSYLSGIQRELEPFFPTIQTVCHLAVATRTLRGCKRLCRKEVHRHQPLSTEDIERAVERHAASRDHDQLLFLAQLLVGFCALHRLGELVWPDNIHLQSYLTVAVRHKVEWVVNGFTYFLPGHKGDRSFEGNRIMVQQLPGRIDPVTIFKRYIISRDSLFPGNPFLWVRKDGSIPKRSWFLLNLKTVCPDSGIGGHSIRAGGAVALAMSGVPPERIQDIGRWTTDTFKIYIRKNPVVLHSLLSGRPVFDGIFN